MLQVLLVIFSPRKYTVLKKLTMVGNGPMKLQMVPAGFRAFSLPPFRKGPGNEVDIIDY